MNIAPRVIATMRAVVRTEAMIIFMGLASGREDAERRIAQTGANQNAVQEARPERRSSVRALRGSAQAGPIVGDQDRIARIRRIVFHAGGLASDEAFKTDLS